MEARNVLSRAWMKRYEDSHPICRAPDPSFVPRRLLYVGSQDHGQLRLLDIDSFPSTQPMKYAALSYCWGP
jgi:hypothetical protein